MKAGDGRIELRDQTVAQVARRLAPMFVQGLRESGGELVGVQVDECQIWVEHPGKYEPFRWAVSVDDEVLENGEVDNLLGALIDAVRYACVERKSPC